MERMVFYILGFIFSVTGLVHATARNEKTVTVEETRTKIAVIDTGITATPKLKPFLCKHGHISLVDDFPLKDGNSFAHGTNVAGLIAENLDVKRECLLIIKFYKDGFHTDFFKKVKTAVEYATFREVKFINMSLGGDGASDLEKLAISNAVEKGIRVAVAAGNGIMKPIKDKNGLFIRLDGTRDKKDSYFHRYHASSVGQDLDKNCYYFPACYNFSPTYFRVVGSNTGYVNEFGGTTNYSNYGKKVTHWENGTNVGIPALKGTSQATATHLGKWVREIYK